jgi:hypothetical protein
VNKKYSFFFAGVVSSTCVLYIIFAFYKNNPTNKTKDLEPCHHHDVYNWRCFSTDFRPLSSVATCCDAASVAGLHFMSLRGSDNDDSVTSKNM